METLVLSAADIRAIAQDVTLDLLMDEVVHRLERLCCNHKPDQFEIPTRDGFHDDNGGLLEWMPATDGQFSSIKLVGYHPKNPQNLNLPTILSVGLTFDNTNGHLRALADATFATALRTGAASAVASRILAIPQARTLGLIGAGAQSISQLHALSRSFDFESVLVYDINQNVSQTFASRAQYLGLNDTRIHVATLDDVLSQSDILCTATSVGVGAGPVLHDGQFKTHVHINAVGSDLPGKTELPLSLLRRSFVATDFIPQAIKEGECQQLAKHEIGPDLIELVQGSTQFAAKRPEMTVFDSTGFALEDFVVLEMLHEHAIALGLGSLIQIEGSSLDPANPYAFLYEPEQNGVAH